MLEFILVPRDGSVPSHGNNVAFLHIDYWNDYRFVTMFHVTIFDENSEKHDLGSVKIGFCGQTETTSTYSTLGSKFTTLPQGYFSVGTDVDYYRTISQTFSDELRTQYLVSLRDVANDKDHLDLVLNERVFQISLLRSLNINTVTKQFRRVLDGGAPLTNYEFHFTQDPSDRIAGYSLEFTIEATSTPPTNIHAIIGRNGVGKTTLLNSMTRALTEINHPGSRFEHINTFIGRRPIGSDYFSGLISVSFSAFDPFNPPKEQSDPSKGTCYFYVGLKSYADESGALLKSQTDLADEFIESLSLCLSERARSGRWLEAIRKLESDDNFAEMNLPQLLKIRKDKLDAAARHLLRRMSSGHAIVLLTITKLVARVDEKTLVLFDEPESHLHPPLLSALIRSLSGLLSNRNAIAIIATHSPVVLQEVPRSCVWKITRSGTASEWHRPEIETFGENVGSLTREVFGLEVAKSGFNALLMSEANQGKNYEEIISTLNDQLGFEGKAILRAIMNRTKQIEI